MEFKVRKELYSKGVLLKTSYHFTDDYYVYLDADEESYYVSITPKDSDPDENIEGLFKNELLSQATREEIYNKTSDIRELILARAFASTIIEEDTEVSEASNEVNEDGIFEDWFKNES